MYFKLFCKGAFKSDHSSYITVSLAGEAFHKDQAICI